jgi:TonB family protein
MRHLPSIPILLAAASVAFATASPAQRSAPPDEDGYELSPVEQNPVMVNRKEIESEARSRFPTSLPERVLGGSVLVRVRVLRDGSVDSVMVLWASDPAFADPARAIGMHMRFTPALVGGRAVSAWMPMDLQFNRQPPTQIEAPSEGTALLSELDEPLRLLNPDEIRRELAANYPPAMREAGVPGFANIEFRVSENGTVDPVTIWVTDASRPEFVEPAMAVARKFRFSRPRVHRQPVRVRVGVPIHFEKTREDPAPPPRP